MTHRRIADQECCSSARREKGCSVPDRNFNEAALTSGTAHDDDADRQSDRGRRPPAISQVIPREDRGGGGTSVKWFQRSMVEIIRGVPKQISRSAQMLAGATYIEFLLPGDRRNNLFALEIIKAGTVLNGLKSVQVKEVETGTNTRPRADLRACCAAASISTIG